MHCNTKVYAQALNFDHVCTSVIVFSLSGGTLCTSIICYLLSPSESDVWCRKFSFQGSVLLICCGKHSPSSIPDSNNWGISDDIILKGLIILLCICVLKLGLCFEGDMLPLPCALALTTLPLQCLEILHKM